MPIKSEHISQGIYHHRWIGHVTIRDVEQALDIEKEFFAQDEISKYISILDGSELVMPPFNLSKLAKMRTNNEYRRIIYKAPIIAINLGQIVSNIARLSVEFYDDWDETLARAQELIAEYQATTSG